MLVASANSCSPNPRGSSPVIDVRSTKVEGGATSSPSSRGSDAPTCDVPPSVLVASYCICTCCSASANAGDARSPTQSPPSIVACPAVSPTNSTCELPCTALGWSGVFQPKPNRNPPSPCRLLSHRYITLPRRYCHLLMISLSPSLWSRTP